MCTSGTAHTFALVLVVLRSHLNTFRRGYWAGWSLGSTTVLMVVGISCALATAVLLAAYAVSVMSGCYPMEDSADHCDSIMSGEAATGAAILSIARAIALVNSVALISQAIKTVLFVLGYIVWLVLKQVLPLVLLLAWLVSAHAKCAVLSTP